MNVDRIIFLGCIFFLLGVVAYYFIKLSFVLIFTINLIVFLFYFIFKRELLIISFIIVSFNVGYVIAEIRTSKQPDSLELFFNKEVLIEGVIIGELNTKAKTESYVVEIENINDRKINTKILVYEKGISTCSNNDLFISTGLLTKPKIFFTNSGALFDYKKFLAKDGIFAILNVNKSPCTKGKIARLSPFLNSRNFLISKSSSFFDTDESALLNGIVLGIKSGFSKELLEIFIITGLIHIVVLSGYNITIVAEGVRRAFSFLSKKPAIILGIIAIVLFVLLSGGNPASIRAGIMASIVLFAKFYNRDSQGVRLLLIACVFMTIINPAQIVFDVSFQLSFLATLGLILFSKKLEDKIIFITDRFQIRTIIATTLSVQLFILPFIIYKLGIVSLIGLITNIIILPIVPFTMFLGLLLFFLVAIFPFLVFLVAPILKLFLNIIIGIASFMASIPFSSIEISSINIYLVILFYILVLWNPLKEYLKN